MVVSVNPAKRGTFARWVGAHAVGWSLGAAAGWMVGSMPGVPWTPAAGGMLSGAAFGVAAAPSQWLALRWMGWRGALGPWALATAAGWGIAALVSLGAGVRETPHIGAFIGLAQWPLFRREVPGASAWLLISLLGGLVLQVDVPSVGSLALGSSLPWGIQVPIIGATLGGVYGVVTGAVMRVTWRRTSTH